MANCASLQLKIPPERIHYLKFILEGYDNLAILSTVDARQGLVKIRYAPETEKEITDLLRELTSDIVK